MADVLYPPRGAVVDGHEPDDKHFVTACGSFVREWTASDQRAVLAAQVEDIGRRIDALEELVSKGIHAVVTQREVEMCVVHLYLLFAGLLAMLKPEELAELSTPGTSEAAP
ncbi:MAG TPA: hypothetical protein VEP50_15730 [bacterium]|nr:hypothetical protein [bacterium]